MGFIHKYQWNKILLYFLPLFWMYKATMSENFGEKSIINTLMLSSRGLTIVLFSIFGWMLMAQGKRASVSVRRGLILSVYMLLIAFLTKGGINISLFAILFFWSVTFYITEKIKLSRNDIGLIAIVASIICNVMAMDFMHNYPKLHLTVLEVEQRVAAYNSIYYVMSASIFIFLVPNKMLKIVFLFLPCFAMLLAGKSTCLVAMVMSIFFDSYKTVVHSRHKLLIIVVLVLVGTLALHLSKGILDFQELLSGFNDDVDSGGNGRFEIWSKVFHAFVASDFLYMLLGHGPSGVNLVANIGGHNDFVEILFDYGVIGFIIYMSFWWALVKRINLFEEKSDIRMAYIISLIIYATASMFSNFINTQIQMLFFVMFWGVVYNQVKYEHRSSHF